MARIQILELPRKTIDEEIPFAIIIDQNEMTRIENNAGETLRSIPRDAPEERLVGIAEKLGARAVIVFDGTVDIA